MTIAWYDPTNHHVSTNKNDPLFTPLGQLWPLVVKREWVGLTEKDKNDCLVSADPCECLADPEAHQLMEDVEAKLKERNA